MCSTVKLPRQNESEELLSDIGLSEDEVLVHQAISTPCASFETADTFWVHDHSRSSVTYSEDEHLQTTSDMQQLEQLGCEEGDHDDQEVSTKRSSLAQNFYSSFTRSSSLFLTRGLWSCCPNAAAHKTYLIGLKLTAM